MISSSNYTRLAVGTTILTLVVILFGAYVRLSNAGLSCPDWPGCYGKVLVPATQSDIATANEAFPERPVDVRRAWLEMIHRYLASLLGLAILALAFLAWRRRRRPGQLVLVPFALVALVIFQGMLGMWTVTLLLKPIVVTAHLIGGFTTLALLWWLCLRQGRLFLRPITSPSRNGYPRASGWIVLGVLLLVGQIFLGGWTSTNYAALACPDLPKCQGEWLPALDAKEAFVPWRGLGTNYEGGVLDNTGRVTIHFAHRVGAILVTLYFLGLCVYLFTRRHPPFRAAAVVLFVGLSVQIGLGLSNVLLHLPLSVAVAHNGGAAILLLITLTVYHVARPPTSVVL